jgi:hypothetical protein
MAGEALVEQRSSCGRTAASVERAGQTLDRGKVARGERDGAIELFHRRAPAILVKMGIGERDRRIVGREPCGVTDRFECGLDLVPLTRRVRRTQQVARRLRTGREMRAGVVHGWSVAVLE